MRVIGILLVVAVIIVAAGCGRSKKDDEEAKARDAGGEAVAGGEAIAEGEAVASEAEAEEGSGEATEGEAEETTVAAEETEPELDEIKLTEADHGKEIELKVGQILVVTLASDPASGLRWDIAPLVDPVVKRVGKREYTPPEPEGEGAAAGGKLT